MNLTHIIAFLPELALFAGALAIFIIALGENSGPQARRAALVTALATFAAALYAFRAEASLFSGAYAVDTFSQSLKVVFAAGFFLVLLSGRSLPDIREEVKPEYYLLLTISVSGLLMLVSCIEIISMVIAMELSAFPLYLMVPMRRERSGQRAQMESAIKYIMFGVAANGLMFFGFSYLYGLTGTLHLPALLPLLAPLLASPMAITGLVLVFCGIFYKLAVFPFHFWSPDVYEGSAHETAGLIASLPKIAAVAIMVRFLILVAPAHQMIATLLAVLATASMFYGNLIALAQQDFKRLLGFSAIAHAGYAMIGFVVLNASGFAAALFYMIGYLFMILACFTVITVVSRDGLNVSIEDLAGLHRRSPFLALTLAVAVFGLAGIPPFAGFMGKLTLLKIALERGYLALVIIAVVNTAIAIYYYLQVVREAYFRDPGERPEIRVNLSTRMACAALILGILILGLLPERALALLSASVTAAAGAQP